MPKNMHIVTNKIATGFYQYGIIHNNVNNKFQFIQIILKPYLYLQAAYICLNK